MLRGHLRVCRAARAAADVHGCTAQAEAAVLAADRARGAGGAGRGAAWNHGEFRVAYASLAPHLCLGGVYVRLLLEGLDQVPRAPALARLGARACRARVRVRVRVRVG